MFSRMVLGISAGGSGAGVRNTLFRWWMCQGLSWLSDFDGCWSDFWMGDATTEGDKAGIEFGNCCSALVSWMLLVWMFVSSYDDEYGGLRGSQRGTCWAV
jgi:hypothetical protein